MTAPSNLQIGPLATTGSGTATSIAPAFPAGASIGDIAFLDWTSGGGGLYPSPIDSRWTAVIPFAGYNTNTIAVGLYWTVVEATDLDDPGNPGNPATVTLTITAARSMLARIWTMTGQLDTFSAVENDTSNVSTNTVNGITPVAADCYRFDVAFIQEQSTGTSVTSSGPSGFTTDINDTTTSAGQRNANLYLAHIALTGQAGVAQGATTSTPSASASSVGISLTVCAIVAPPPPPPPPTITVTTAPGTQVRPRVAVRIRAVWDDVVYSLWRGLITEWDLNYIGILISQATAQCVDVTRIFNAYSQLAQPAPLLGIGEDTGARMNRILDTVSWPRTDRIIATGDSVLQGTDLSGYAWTQMLDAVDSEAGQLYIDASGHVVFTNRRAVFDQTQDGPVAVFGDQPGELSLYGVELAYDDGSLFNIIDASGQSGNNQESRDAALVQRDEPSQYSASSVELISDTDTLNYTGWLLHLCKNPEFRVSGLTIKPRRDPNNLWPVALGLGYNDLIQVNLTPPGGGTPRLESQGFIRGITHSITPKGDWTTAYTLQSATAFRSVWTIGDAEYGKVGEYSISW